eukprot:CAMPEP_0204863270 /NCGR_PEP_ID=MMETSP1348-20121228/3191_1 /ASSEMBLY_ACC=CAM_ASM_000700 /TAXON_ID=215587 /ORGANISM="Aplanochytrium stocchinoi, Strain GSBS06" /LENGTH=601 /DNA_ID=CAMNT_0052013557 /DNA_START=275 /DNA_END=2080 /DNA_ORIENTATION=-
MASATHWKLYWTVFGFWYFLDRTILLPFSVLLIPKLYNLFKSILLIYLYLPETNGLLQLVSLLDDTPYGKALLLELSRLVDLPRDYETFKARAKKAKGKRRSKSSLDSLLEAVKNSKAPITLDFRLRQLDEGHLAWKKRVQKQSFVLAEIVKTEDTFNESLIQIHEKIGVHILNDNLFEWSDEEIAKVLIKFFKTWHLLTKSHTKIEAMFHMLINVQDKKVSVNVDGVLKLLSILETAMDVLLPRVYNDYCSLYELALKVFSLELNQNAEFRDFIQTQKQSLPKRGLEIHLIRPVQRLCQYPLLLKELRKTMAPGETYDRLDALINNMNELASIANAEAARAKNMMMMAQVNEMLRWPATIGGTGKKKERLISLMESGKREIFVGKSNVGEKPLPGMNGVFVKTSTIPKPKRLNVLLYNDLILITQVKKSWLPPHEKIYQVKLMLPLAHSELIQPKRENDFLSWTDETIYSVGISNHSWGDMPEILLGFTDESERNFWTKNIKNALKYANNHVHSSEKLFKMGKFPQKVVVAYATAPVAADGNDNDVDKGKERSAAILIQSQYRGMSARKQYKERREVMLNSVLLIQRFATRQRRKRNKKK